MKSQAEGDKKERKKRKEGVLEKLPSSWDKSRLHEHRIQQIFSAFHHSSDSECGEKKGEKSQGLTQARFKPKFPTCATYIVFETCHYTTNPRTQQALCFFLSFYDKIFFSAQINNSCSFIYLVSGCIKNKWIMFSQPSLNKVLITLLGVYFTVCCSLKE